MHPRIRASNADGIRVGFSLVPTPRLIAFMWYGSSLPARAASNSFFSKPVAWSIGSGISDMINNLLILSSSSEIYQDLNLEAYLVERIYYKSYTTCMWKISSHNSLISVTILFWIKYIHRSWNTHNTEILKPWIT